MLFLDAENQLILTALKNRFELDKKDRVKRPLDIKGVDFDSTTYRLYGTVTNDQEVVTLSIRVLCDKVLVQYGLETYLKKVYGDWVQTPEKDFTATISFSIDVDDKEKEKILTLVPLFKRYVMMPPFIHTFDRFPKNEKFDNIHIPYRNEENIYIIYFEKALSVVYSIKFDDPDDIILAKVFLQEFKDARRDKALGNAPSVSFSQGVKPLELQGIKSSEPEDPTLLKAYGFVSLSLRESHCNEEMRYLTVDKLLQFRNYLHYHIKCSKAYMHIKMRSRVSQLLEGLEQVKDKNGIKVKAKTFQGKTFEQN